MRMFSHETGDCARSDEPLRTVRSMLRVERDLLFRASMSNQADGN